MTVQLSLYAQTQQANVLAEIIRVDGQMRLYEGDQRPLDQRTDGRLVECKITTVIVEGGTITVKWDQATVTKDGQADFYRITSRNIPVLGGKIGDSENKDKGEEFQMFMSVRNLLAATEKQAATVIDAGQLIHLVLK